MGNDGWEVPPWCYCILFTIYFDNKTTHIHTELDTLVTQSIEICGTTACNVIWDSFEFLKSKEMDKILCIICSAIWRLNLCPWPLWATKEGEDTCIHKVLNYFFKEGVHPSFWGKICWEDTEDPGSRFYLFIFISIYSW